ncbi:MULTISPECIES: hypothetical protein [Bacillus]|uniref:hypothetical protein n=1 Tax=Bacillus TaxID=1386 RepID=UPI00066FDC88|nr:MULTISPECIES: hypothetical protein [Bacillus]MED0773679.1 hypothetical protein [Bacillus siamensis]MED0777674.1 hypothetical protein [Bacillus siamensis]MED0781551.1 hypothetical protein [Bacillus siamensis]MED0836386.1 hypothetical protein [Bacillus siamensis]
MNTKCIKDNKKLAADIPSASFFSFHHGEPSARVTGSGFLLTYYGICLTLMSFAKKRPDHFRSLYGVFIVCLKLSCALAGAN